MDNSLRLWLPNEGSASHAELVEYVRSVMSENTDLKPGYNPTGSFDKLARGTVFSILRRLGIQWEEPDKMQLPPVGSIGLIKVEGVVGDLIRVGQWLDGDGFADYEHAFVLTDGTNIADARVVEAEPGGCRREALAAYRGRRVLWLRCPAGYSTSVALAALSYVGVSYSDADYFAIAAKRLELPIATPLRWLVEESGHVICSQLADAAAFKGGWNLFPNNTNPGYVTPARLAKLAPAGSVPQLIE